MRAVLYERVSTARQGESGLGLKSQRQALHAECERRGWTVVGTFTDKGASGKSMKNRPQLAKALEIVDSGEGDVLMVAKLDRLSRSLLDFASLTEQSRSNGWAVVALDLGVDTTTPAGEMMASVLAAFSQYERRLISQRTSDALAVAKSRGTKLGRPQSLPMAVVDRVIRERLGGSTYQQIADGLTADGIETAQGGAWRAGTISYIVKAAQREAGGK